MHKYLREACSHGATGDPHRKAFIGAIGKRRDGTLVKCHNGLADDRKPSAHAEARLARKLGRGAIVYVGRVLRSDGSIALSKPCARCEAVLRNKGVSKVYYTIGPMEWGCIEL